MQVSTGAERLQVFNVSSETFFHGNTWRSLEPWWYIRCHQSQVTSCQQRDSLRTVSHKDGCLRILNKPLWHIQRRASNERTMGEVTDRQQRRRLSSVGRAGVSQQRLLKRGNVTKPRSHEATKSPSHDAGGGRSTSWADITVSEDPTSGQCVTAGWITRPEAERNVASVENFLWRASVVQVSWAEVQNFEKKKPSDSLDHWISEFCQFLFEEPADAAEPLWNSQNPAYTTHDATPPQTISTNDSLDLSFDMLFGFWSVI